MLSKKNRTRRDKSEKTTGYGRSKTVSSPHMSLQITPIKDAQYARFIFIVSRKVSNLAIKRNLLKRRARHMVKLFLPAINKNFTYKVFFRKQSLDISFNELKESFLALIKKGGVYESRTKFTQ